MINKKEFGDWAVVFWKKGSKTLHIAQNQGDLGTTNYWMVGTTTRQFDYESGWLPNKEWTSTIKGHFSKEKAIQLAKENAEKALNESKYVDKDIEPLGKKLSHHSDDGFIDFCTAKVLDDLNKGDKKKLNFYEFWDWAAEVGSKDIVDLINNDFKNGKLAKDSAVCSFYKTYEDIKDLSLKDPKKFIKQYGWAYEDKIKDKSLKEGEMKENKGLKESRINIPNKFSLSLEESAGFVKNENVYDFTNLDEDENTFNTIIKEFNLMELSREEIESLGLDISVQNSVVGVYGSYVSGNGTPDVVVYDFEISDRQRPYKYTINVVQIQEHDRAEKYFYIISSRLSQMLDDQSKGLKEGCLDHIKDKWQSELDKGIEPKILEDPWAVCEGMKWLGKDGWIRVEEVLIPTEYEEPYPDFYMEIFDQHTCAISHDIYTINEINSYVRSTKARLVNNGIRNLVNESKLKESESELCPRDAYNKRQREINRENDVTLAYGKIDDAMSAEFVKDSFFKKIPGSHHWSETVGNLTFICSVDEDNYSRAHFSTYKNKERIDSKYVYLNGDCVEQFYAYISDWV